jgi:hypothetical protein
MLGYYSNSQKTPTSSSKGSPHSGERLIGRNIVLVLLSIFPHVHAIIMGGMEGYQAQEDQQQSGKICSND